MTTIGAKTFRDLDYAFIKENKHYACVDRKYIYYKPVACLFTISHPFVLVTGTYENLWNKTVIFISFRLSVTATVRGITS